MQFRKILKLQIVSVAVSAMPTRLRLAPLSMVYIVRSCAYTHVVLHVGDIKLGCIELTNSTAHRLITLQPQQLIALKFMALTFCSCFST